MRRKVLGGGIVVACFLMALSFQAMGANIRPYPGVVYGYGNSLTYSGTPYGETSIQTVMNTLPGGGWVGYNAITDQNNTAYFNYDSQNLNSTFDLRIEQAGNAGINSMGLYANGNTSNFVQIFAGPASGPNAVATIHWNDATSGFILEFDGSANISSTFSGFSHDNFGIYFQTPSDRYYSEDVLNTTDGGNPHILGYQSKTSPLNWLFAFEDTQFNSSDHDFNDMVITAESLSPVPEPGTMMLLGSGLVGLAGWGRKKFRK